MWHEEPAWGPLLSGVPDSPGECMSPVWRAAAPGGPFLPPVWSACVPGACCSGEAVLPLRQATPFRRPVLPGLWQICLPTFPHYLSPMRSGGAPRRSLLPILWDFPFLRSSLPAHISGGAPSSGIRSPRGGTMSVMWRVPSPRRPVLRCMWAFPYAWSVANCATSPSPFIPPGSVRHRGTAPPFCPRRAIRHPGESGPGRDGGHLPCPG